ncbi:UNVERIFIED_CONTAM: hypothetical protein Sradi_6231200 [Sesamum radiatum]|uniref:Uncharacterized protein n=1 Tax=Sesamum radiatum TaxID=300843 RepID=A0AAW2K9W2_SESRA
MSFALEAFANYPCSFTTCAGSMPTGGIHEKAIDEVMIDLVGSSGEEGENPAASSFISRYGTESEEEGNIREEEEKEGR